LGLSQVLETVNRHGGQIRCGEDASGGACFVVRLPLGA
jgi:signal transduction histidine kinase